MDGLTYSAEIVRIFKCVCLVKKMIREMDP
jgi:hypothetical protein